MLPHGGGNLSGGQRQLIALTGALASCRALAIVDEAMANIDNSLIINIVPTIETISLTFISAKH